MRRSVLIVDDDPSLRDLLGFFLEQAGFAVRSVEDGYSALDELSLNRYDLLFADISMPHMNGFKLLRALRSDERYIALPVIVLTASHDSQDVIKMQQYAISDYVIKPPQKEDLLKRVERVLGGLPQFEEVLLEPTEELATGSFTLPVKVRSISINGIVLHSPVPLERRHLLENLCLQLFQKIGLTQTKFIVTDCAPLQKGGYEYFLCFLGLPPEDQEKIRDWIMVRSFEKRNSAV